MIDFWDNLAKSIAALVAVVLVVFIFICMFSDHKVRSYYLHQSGNNISIYKDIDWCSDEAISLDRTVTYDEALTMLERLNKTIK